jgi:hypothetical protein
MSLLNKYRSQCVVVGNQSDQIERGLRTIQNQSDYPRVRMGICMVLVCQWLLEVKSQRDPVEMTKELLHGNLGIYGFNALFIAQKMYGSGTKDDFIDLIPETPLMPGAREDDKMLQSCTGGMLHLIYQGQCRKDSTLLKIEVENTISLTRIQLIGLYGHGWGHAIGAYCVGTIIYIFDPNFGLFQFTIGSLPLTNFFKDLWKEYSAISATVAQIGER